jgi:superfamily II DNA or RNA helicase
MREIEYQYRTMAEAALGAPLAAAELPPDPEFESPHPSQASVYYTLALRGLASLRRAERTASPDDFDNEAWQPLPAEMADLRRRHEPVARQLAMTSNLKSHIDAYEQDPRRTNLREHQKDAMSAFLRFLQTGSLEDTMPATHLEHDITKSGFMDLPTAYGKTFVMVELAKALGIGKPASEASPRRLRALVLEPLSFLVRQTIQEFEDHAPEINATPYYGQKRDPDGDVIVMTYATFIRMQENGQLEEFGFDIALGDEIHTAMGVKTSEKLADFRRNMIMVGMTASTDYGNGRKVDDIMNNLVHRTEVRAAIENGILSPVQCVSYKTGAEVLIKKLGANGDYIEQDLAPLIENAARNHHATLFAKTAIEKGLQGIIECIPGGECAHPQALAKQLNEMTVRDAATGEERPIRAEAVGAFLPDGELEDIFTRYEAGEIDVLTFVKIIGMGWDSNQAKFLISLCPSRSPVRAIQRLGRVLRGDEMAYVVEFIDEMAAHRQYTFMHILGEEFFWQDYSAGPMRLDHDGKEELVIPALSLPPELQEGVTRLHAEVVDSLTLERRYATEVAPEGWLSMPLIASFCEGMNRQYIRKLLFEQGFEWRMCRGKVNTPTYFFEPAALEYLQANMIWDRPKEDWLQRDAIRKANDISQSMVDRLIRDLGFAGRQCRSPHRNMIRDYYTPEEAEQIAAVVNAIKVADPTQPERHTWDDMAADWGVSKALVFNKCKEMNMEGTIKRTHERGPMANYFTDAQRETLRQALNVKPPAPEGWHTIGTMARLARVGRTVVERYIAEQDVADQAVEYRVRVSESRLGPNREHWPPALAKEIMQAVGVQEVPEGWQSLKGYAEDNGITWHQMRVAIAKLNLQPVRYRIDKARSRPQEHVSAADFQRVREYFGGTHD